MELLSIHRYPVKSLGGHRLSDARIGALGIEGDRRFMLVDASGRFVSARERPELLLWQVGWRTVCDIDIVAPDGAAHVPQITDERTTVRIWDDEVIARGTDAATDVFLTAHLGPGLRLVFIDDPSPRAIDPKYGQPGDAVGFADGYPILLLSEESHAALEQRAGETLSILRFRPNLIVRAPHAHAEDDWKHIRIGACTFDVVKPCVRCVLTTMDPLTGLPHPNREPLRTLIDYRRGAKGVTFGMNVIARAGGVISIGDSIEVVS